MKTILTRIQKALTGAILRPAPKRIPKPITLTLVTEQDLKDNRCEAYRLLIP
jgi:hypothetical protein